MVDSPEHERMAVHHQVFFCSLFGRDFSDVLYVSQNPENPKSGPEIWSGMTPHEVSEDRA